MGYKMLGFSLIKLEINLIQLTLQIRQLCKFLKCVLFSLNLQGREPYFKRGEIHQHQ